MDLFRIVDRLSAIIHVFDQDSAHSKVTKSRTVHAKTV